MNMNKLNKLVKVLAYIRYSSHNQDDGNSVSAQISCIEKYCADHGMEVEKYYIDEAKTGRNTNRPQYQQMLHAIENGTFDAKIIVVRAIDRLHRNAKNQLSDLEWLAKHCMRLISVTDGIDTATETSKLLTTIKAAVAEDFSDTLSKNTRGAMLELAKQGRHLGGVPPIGYKVNAEGFYEIDEVKAPIVREIFKLYLQDMGYDCIIKQMQQKGYKTNEGRDFSKSSINGILKNPKYMGTYVYDKSAPKDSEGKRNSHAAKKDYIQIKDGMPAIITPADFHKVQEKMANHQNKYQHRNSKHYYPLNGKLHCAKCGKAFSGNVNKCKGKSYYSYKANCTCGIKSIKMDKLNRFVFYGLQQCLFNPGNKEKILEMMNKKLTVQHAMQSEEVTALTNKINGLENAQNNLTGYLEAGRATQTILNKLEKNEAELAILRTQLAAKKQEVSSVSEDTYKQLVKQFLHYMCHNKTSEAYALRDAMIERIDIDAEAVTIHFHIGVTADDDTVRYFNDYREV